MKVRYSFQNLPREIFDHLMCSSTGKFSLFLLSLADISLLIVWKFKEILPTVLICFNYRTMTFPFASNDLAICSVSSRYTYQRVDTSPYNLLLNYTTKYLSGFLGLLFSRQTIRTRAR
uniref:Uncharacterized protein n=1 Tax=Cacopsylla melanoneura TaxID=428564 RepID=A0A8D8M4M1_9HEMI